MATAGSRRVIYAETISFGRCVCGEEPIRPGRFKPSWATAAAWECVTFDEDERLTRLPVVGETCRIRLTFPFVEHAGNEFLFLVHGDDLPRSSGTGNTGSIAGSCMIRVRTQSVTMEPPSSRHPRGHAVATALVLDLIGMDDLLRLPALEGPIFESWHFYGSHAEHVRDGAFRYMSCDAEGDLGAFAIWHESDDRTASLLVAGGWGHHESFAVAGRRILSQEDVAFLSMSMA